MTYKKTLLSFLLVGLLTSLLVPSISPVKAAPVELFFSEYVEGTNNNKALEIYNGTGADVDLATNKYTIEIYFDGDVSPGSVIALTGTVADGDVYVVADQNAAPEISSGADQVATVSLYSGNDAVALLKDGELVDVIGRIGENVYSWGAAPFSTRDQTLRRKSYIEAGDANSGDAFDPALEWNGYPVDSFDGLGSHDPSITPIFEIQYTADASGDSPKMGQAVTTEGIVTAVFQYGYFIEGPSGGPWNGLWVYDTTAPAVGDRLRLTGSIVEYNNLTELATPTEVQTLASGVPLPAPQILKTGEVSQEKWEGVLVRAENVTVTDDDLGYGEWAVNDGTGDVTIDDKGEYTYSPTNGDAIAVIVGPLDYSFGAFKIQPRDDNDIMAIELAEIIITEVMQNPAAVDDSLGEWFEIYNAASSAVDLSGWTISDTGIDSFIIGGSHILEAGEYFVLGINGDPAVNGGVDVDIVTSGYALANGDDEIILSDADGYEIDRVAYDGGATWPDPTGASMMLIDSASDNNIGTNWQETPADLTYGLGDRGTPGCPNTGCIPEYTPISDIQYTADPSGDSPFANQTVTTQGIVVGVYGDGYVIEEAGGGPWSGLFVYDTTYSPALGDLVQVSGTVQEYYNLTELSAVTELIVLSSGNTLPGPDIVATGDVAQEAYEGVLLQVQNVTVTNDDLGYGEWEVDDGSGPARVDDKASYTYSPVNGDLIVSLTGVLFYNFGDYKLEPRDDADIHVASDLIITEVLYDVEGDDDGFEWVELYNRGISPVSLSNWSLGNGGTDYTYSVVPLCGVLNPGQAFIVGGPSQADSNGNPIYSEVSNFDPDFQNGGSTADGVALFNIPADQVTAATIPMDAVIYGDANTNGLIDATGTAPVPQVGDAPSGQSIQRDLATDTWAISTPSPAPDPVQPPCSPDGLPLSIPEIQGSDFTSTYTGYFVRTTGTVIGYFEGNLPSGGGDFDGFYIQDASGDGDPATSDGILINHATLDVEVSIGDQVTVLGTVQEFNEYGDPPPATETQIMVGSVEDVIVAGTTAPPPMVVMDPPGDPELASAYYEALEGMAVTLPMTGVVVGPTSYGTIMLVPGDAGVERVMRGSPQQGMVFGVRPEERYGSGAPNLIVGSVVEGVDGPMAYTYGTYAIADQDGYTVVDESPVPAEVPTWPAATANSLTVASFNTYNFDDTGTELAKVADTIVALGAPLLVGLQEIAVETVMPDLLGDLVAAGYSYDYAYSHPDVGEHGVALLWRTDRISDVDWSTDYQDCSPVGSTSSDYDPLWDTCQATGEYPLFSRRPVVATTTVMLDGAFTEVTVIANHFKSKLGGLEADQRRLEQAQFIGDIVNGFVTANPNAKIVVLGDLNDFEDSPPLMALVESGNLNNLWGELAPGERYSYIYQGVSQVLDHVLVSPALLPSLQAVGPLHTNADFPYNPFAGDPSVIWRTSDHDPVAATFTFVPPTAAFTPSATEVMVDESVTFTNESTGDEPLAYQWDFGDGTSSTEESPTHSWTLPGTYVVTLTTSNALGSASSSTTIHVLPKTVTFEDFDVILSRLTWQKQAGDRGEFLVRGRITLPEGSSLDNLGHELHVAIELGGERAVSTVPLSGSAWFWSYHDQPSSAVPGLHLWNVYLIWSNADEGRSAVFTIRGTLTLPNVNYQTRPAEVDILMEMPITDDPKVIAVQGNRTVTYTPLRRVWWYKP